MFCIHMVWITLIMTFWILFNKITDVINKKLLICVQLKTASCIIAVLLKPLISIFHYIYFIISIYFTNV